MRQITRKIVSAFERREALKIDNSRTDGTSLWLFENKIAEWRTDGLWISNAGWKSNTTKERLNGLTGVGISSVRGKWFLNNVEWNGQWVNVDDFSFVDPYYIAVENVAVRAEPEPVFDITSEWMSSGYSRPVYSVFHTNIESELEAIELKLTEAGIPSRRMESDTVGKYQPNYFVVVRPQDLKNSLIIIKQ